MIYISHRQLSRITKVSYPSGEVVWNMGLPSEYNTGNQNICTDLLFSFQHHVQMLENGNLLFFDNGNLSEMLIGDSYPTSRIREIKVIDDSYCETIWQYDLPQNLYGWAQGSAQLLENGNYLVYTHGNGDWGNALPSILEITSEGDIIWKAFSQNEGVGWYRAYKLPSIHPNAFSVLFDQYQNIDVEGNLYSGIVLDTLSSSLSFKIYNKSGYNQHYVYTINDYNESFEQLIDTLIIEDFAHIVIDFDSNVHSDSYMTLLNFEIWPLFHDYAVKAFNYNVYYSNGLLSSKKKNQSNKITSISAFPNPFNSAIKLHYYLSESNMVNITIYDIMGRIVNRLVSSYQYAGHKSIYWNATNNKGKLVSAGVYLYKIKAGDYIQTKKMILLK